MIGLNIKLLRKRSKKSQEEVSSALGLTRSSYSGYENGVAEPSIVTLLSICDYFQVNIDMVARRDFSKFNEGDWNLVRKDTTTDIDGKHIRILTTTVDSSENELIEMVPLKASAGYTSGYADEAYIKVLPTFSLPFLSKNKKYRSFPIQGDSMPPVSEGSQVIGEFVQNWSLIKNGTPCILVTKDDGIVFKVIYNHIASNQSLQLCSTNPYYAPYFIHVNEVIEIWKFVNYIASDLPEVKLDELHLKKSILDLQREIFDLKNSLTKQN